MGTYDEEGNRVAPYKEDSTKGGSMIEPVTYKGDVLAQAWIDSRVLATLSEWLDQNAERMTRFLSEVVRMPLEALVNELVESGKVQMVDDTVTARRMLQQKYRVDLNRGGRGGKNVLHNQILSDRREELTEKIKEGASFRDVRTPVSRSTGQGGKLRKKNWIPIPGYPDYVYPEGDEEARERLVKQLRASGHRSTSEVVDEAIAEMKAEGRLAPPKVKEWNESMAPRKLTEEELVAKEREIEERDRKMAAELSKPPDLEFMRRNVVKDEIE